MLFLKLSVLVPFENGETHLALTVAQKLTCQMFKAMRMLRSKNKNCDIPFQKAYIKVLSY
jgi:hypothetical protein